MKRLLLLISTIFLLSIPALSRHIIGGEMRYQYVGPGSTANSKVYRIIMLLFRGDDATGAPLAGSYIVAIYNNDNNQKVVGNAGSTNNNWLISQDPPGTPSVPIILPQCIQGAPQLNYTYAVYSMTVELQNNTSGYTVAYQTCCRINGLMNVGNNTGSTYSCVIPGTSTLGSGTDSSPAFKLPVNVICKNAPFVLDFGAVDPNSIDSLVYSFCDAFDGGAAQDASFDNPAAPPYFPVNYLPGYSAGNPFGTNASINPQTGIITGTAPDFGKYVVSVCITVYRQGVPIATHRKDLIVQVSDCVLTASDPMPDFVTCDGFNVQFSHSSTGANSVFWDFGDGSTLLDTSNLNAPTYTYADTGTYRIKLVINRGTSCSDSTYRNVGVYPGFFPGFTSAGICYLNPVQFTDTTRATYGVVNTWSWNFGDGSTLADTSRIRNPAWTYAGPGIKTITFIVGSSKGCRDTVTRTIELLDKPPLSVGFADTLICIADDVQLQATGTGNFSWTPLVNISNPNTATPTVDPNSTTTYYVELENGGCRNRDSVRVRVLNVVSVNVGPDTTICQGDPVQLSAVTDGLTYSWTPVATLNDPTILNPVATPLTTTTYQLRSSVGSCSSTDNITVAVVPYPIANAGADTIICYNTGARLNGSHNGSSFTWSPANYLDNPAVLNPLATPPRTTAFVLAAYDTQGCPKPGYDTVMVTVLPKIRPFAGHDTAVIIGQPLQFNATGGESYTWSPGTSLNSTDISNPVGIYDGSFDSIRYTVKVYNAAGCSDSASVLVKIFKTNPTIFVPTAFTPNNDGKNDRIYPIAVGIQRINYFRIFNRWGQMVFSTTTNGHGWDGKIGGVPQGTNVFVWLVGAVDYLGKPYFQKGTVTLIR
jgi:gliding motility-associated-like protein